MFHELTNWIKRLFKPPKIVIRIQDGKAVTAKGKVAKVCLNECSDFFTEKEILSGKIFITDGIYGQKLEFSREIPEQLHQRFRNLWNYHN